MNYSKFDLALKVCMLSELGTLTISVLKSSLITRTGLPCPSNTLWNAKQQSSVIPIFDEFIASDCTWTNNTHPFCQDENAFFPLVRGNFSRIGACPRRNLP